MKRLVIIFFLVFTGIISKADHWLILVNEERVFECISTCSENGFNAKMLKAHGTLKAGDRVTVVYVKDSIEKNITRNIIVSDSAQNDFRTFPIFDPEGNHALAVKADDFASLHKIIIWYSEKKIVNGVEVFTQRIPLVYFE